MTNNYYTKIYLKYIKKCVEDIEIELQHENPDRENVEYLFMRLYENTNLAWAVLGISKSEFELLSGDEIWQIQRLIPNLSHDADGFAVVDKNSV